MLTQNAGLIVSPLSPPGPCSCPICPIFRFVFYPTGLSQLGQQTSKTLTLTSQDFLITVEDEPPPPPPAPRSSEPEAKKEKVNIFPRK